jgi:hypothetical protein
VKYAARLLLSGVLPVLLLAAGLTSCSTPVTDHRDLEHQDLERSISLGFESVTAGGSTLQHLQSKLNDAGATAVSLSVGRLDWAAFPWARYPQSRSGPVRRTGRDYVAEAIKALGHDGTGRKRKTTLTVDALVPGWISADPGIAGISPDGSRSSDFASLSALTHGPVAQRLIAFVTEIVRRYKPDTVDLTELMFDDATFGPDDLASYRSFTGAGDWPRRADHTIDTGAPAIAQWRSTALAGLVTRVRSATHAGGATLDMDVRAPWNSADGDRADSGQDYALLAQAADRLIVWDYFGINSKPASYSADLARSLTHRFGDRFAMSIGMWADTGSIPPTDMTDALRASLDGGATALAVTPASLLDDAAWDAIRAGWQ